MTAVRPAAGGAVLGRPPLLLVAPAVLAATFLIVPLVALVLDAPWADLVTQLGTSQVQDAAEDRDWFGH